MDKLQSNKRSRIGTLKELMEMRDTEFLEAVSQGDIQYDQRDMEILEMKFKMIEEREKMVEAAI